MIEMKVMGIAIDTASGSPIIVLNDIENRKALPIWIGSAEASAIIRKIENIKVAVTCRPENRNKEQFLNDVCKAL